MSKKNLHIVPVDSGWAVKREGQQQPLSQHRTQENADKAARPIAKHDGVELVTHGRDGKIRDKDSFGHDPNPPKDTKH
jgi:hypothetical protein